VDNDLEISYPTTAKIPPDPDIQERIRQILSWTVGLYGQDVRVKVDAGIVDMRGNVETYWMKRKAEDIASHIFGVVKIINNIAVVPGRKVRDEVVARDLISALERSRAVEADAVDIKVENGIVTLSGRIPSLRVCKSIIEHAENTAGVTDIKNKLVVA
jgi:osmotically-inducible protein OsmY